MIQGKISPAASLGTNIDFITVAPFDVVEYVRAEPILLRFSTITRSGEGLISMLLESGGPAASDGGWPRT